MVPFDDDFTHSDSVGYGIRIPESSERETLAQWLPPPPTFYESNRLPSEARPPAQSITKHWLPTGEHVDLPHNHITLANLTGRSYAEAFQDLRRLFPPRESSRRTPSLASDDSHSHDSPSISTPRNSFKDLSLSPEPASEVAQPAFQSNKYSEPDLALPSQSIQEIGPTTESNSTSTSTIQSSANVFQKDVTKCVEPLGVSETSTLRSGAPPRLRRSFQNTFSRHAAQKLGTTATGPPCVAQPYTEEDNSTGYAPKIANDAYLTEPPASGSGMRSRAKKPSKSSTFLTVECPQCPKRFTRNFDMLRHKKTIHVTQTVETISAHTCTCCGEHLSRKDAFKRHIQRIPESCIRFAQQKKRPLPALLPEEMYEIHKIAMMEVLTRQSSHAS